MNETLERPAPVRRLAAVAALVLVAVVLVWTILSILGDPLILVAQIVLLVVVVTTAWIALTRAAALRWLAAAVAVACVVAMVALELPKNASGIVSLAARIGLLLIAAWLGRYALERDIRTLQQNAVPIFVDIDPWIYNINARLIEAKISDRTKVEDL